MVVPFFTSGSVLERVRGVVERLNLEGDYDLLLFDVETPSQRADGFRDFAPPGPRCPASSSTTSPGARWPPSTS